MSVNILSHRCFVCDEPMTMESCLKVYHVAGMKNYELNDIDSTKYHKNFLHRSCKTKLIEEILSKNEGLIIF